ncbi:M3 family metallopeptidase [Amaricoccus solimangrovi]|uniref:M3 family metallopeptidase n=1 Tax=Amaricoccus solimangrovi TaxID=2589815 RepID=A0A501WQ23_9RHOB|nr:M3 family metallopeptidase [Amaricoccus solimangrovi]TPE50204.1 M3 family metallopeptidase [Amaricoccus solimangrovi]
MSGASAKGVETLIGQWHGPFGLPGFDRIEVEAFAPAFDAAMAKARAEIDAIAGDPAAPSFANTIEAMERAEAELDRVSAIFFNIAGAHSSDALEALRRDLSPKLSAHGSATMMNAALFARIDGLMRAIDTLGLTAEQRRVLTLYHRMFRRAGAKLEGADRARLTAVMSRLASLGTAFGQNVLADEKSWEMELAPGDLEGLPDFVVAAAAEAARERGRAGHVVTLSRSLIVPFLQFSPRRDLREKAFRAWVARGANGGETDNRAIVAETLALREERARLLGYPTFAAFKLETEMAKTPEAVRDLLTAVWTPARARAEADAARLGALMREDGVNGDLEPWDWRYYSAIRQKREHDLDEAELKPYLELDHMIAAAFDVAGRLFGLDFTPVDAPLYHPDARAWEVRRDGRHMGVFIGDYFARPSKRSGAWCSSFRAQSKFDGEVRPIVVNVCNFAKAPEGAANLLTFDDARTLFHEFGHALHNLLSDVTYPFISGTSVARDFVELPSQLYEHWLSVPEILARHARHARTGEPMPADLLERLLAARNYDQGFATVEYVTSAMVDLDFHAGPAPADPMAAEAATLGRLGVPHAIRMRHATPHFAHVFTGDGYSSGYYSYMWSEVMDADAFAAFEETGDPFDPAMAGRLAASVYSAGGSRDAAELYAEFRGRLPGVEALLRQRGLLDPV